MIILDGKEIAINKFPDGTLLLKESIQPYIDNNCREARIVWHFENNEEMIAIMFLARHLQSNGVVFVHLVMPYIPNARQDRVKTNEDVFTLKYFTEFINSLGFNSVTVLDPHSSVSEALIDNLIVESPERFIQRAINEIQNRAIISDMPINLNSERSLMLFFPDEGAMKRYSGMLKMNYAFGIKKRDWRTGVIQGLDVSGQTDKIKDSAVLIIDDICSKGGTFYHSAKKLKELGAKNIYLYVSHCENSVLYGDMIKSGLIEKVYTTNSIFTERHEKIEVMNYENESYVVNRLL